MSFERIDNYLIFAECVSILLQIIPTSKKTVEDFGSKKNFMLIKRLKNVKRNKFPNEGLLYVCL